MRRINWIAAGLLVGLGGIAGCHGPYRPMAYRNGEMPMDYGVPVTEGPILGNGEAYPVPSGTMIMPGSVVNPGTPPYMPPSSPPVMPPASGTPAPPLNTPPPTGPMPRSSPTSNPSR